MTNCCDLSNPLIRDGVSQRQRQAPALPPDFVRMDERDFADWLVFAYQLSQQIIYYDLTNQPQGTWHEFFEQSTPVQIARISKTRLQGVKDVYTRQLEKFLGDRSPSNLSALLDILAGMLKQIQQWYEGLDAYTLLKSSIKGLVKTNLVDSLARLEALEGYASTSAPRLALYQAFAQRFGLTPRSTSLVNITAPTVTRFAARTELDAVFQVVFQNYRQIIQIAPGYLSDSLTGRQDQAPHLALYIAFLQLMTLAQNDLNRMTQRHLDFFYRRVLQLPARSSQPDHAHLIFALAKFQTEYKLPAATAFNGGPDASGVDLVYTLDQDIIIHNAQIASLQGLFLASNETGQITGLHESAIANSADGQGEPFPKDQIVKAWQPFGDPQRPQASLGLAIASDIFYLQEGDRVITLILTFDKAPIGLPANALLNLFRMEFSGEKEWIGGTLTAANLQGVTLTLTVTIAAEQKSIGAYHADLPGARLATTKPVVRIYLNHTPIQDRSPYDYFRPLKLTQLIVRTNVTGVRNLILQNEQSVIDPTKPFQPFGSQPKVGANFYIGSKEVFQKRLTQLVVNLELESPLPNNWSDYYVAYRIDTPFSPGKFQVYALRNKTWLPSVGINRPSLGSFEFNTPDELAALKLNHFVDTELAESWNYQTINGFIRLELTGDFLHDQYPTVLSRQVLASATSEIITVQAALPNNVTPPRRKAVIGAYYSTGEAKTYYVNVDANPLVANEPFMPVVRSLSLNYRAEAGKSEYQLFHLHAFDGVVAIAPEEVAPPVFPDYIHEGELFIGLTDLDAPTALPLLVQVAEETAATDLARATVQWFYLKNNRWQPLQPHQIVSDTSNGLITSGIVNLAIPDDIQTGNTLLDTNLYWLKVSVAERSRAVCNIIGLHTQAARVTFSDRGNDPTHLAAPLEAGAIAQLVFPQPEVKTIEQPYASVGGQGQETPDKYYIRISEHLRHKGRAVTIFDYERLVLEQFPQIYKVRCINHSRITDQDRLQELVPGSVTLAVIPDLSQRTTTNDLEPKVNRNLLADIRSYLLERCSFVLHQGASELDNIYVVNPLYEQIQVAFQVAFKSPYSANFDYYQRELKQAIIQFLSPWTVNDGADIHFGGKVYRSSILNFVEEQPYVEHVLNFAMHQGNQRDLREVEASSARSILVSAPFSDTPSSHVIQPIQTYPPTVPIQTAQFGYTPLEHLTLD